MLPSPLGIIEVIHATSISVNASRRRGILSITPQQEPEVVDRQGKPRLTKEQIDFDDDDLVGTSQPHDDALIVTLRIRGFLMKKVMTNQGSGAKIMYSNLYKGLGLKAEDLEKYDTPLVGFDGKIVIPRGANKALRGY